MNRFNMPLIGTTASATNMPTKVSTPLATWLFVRLEKNTPMLDESRARHAQADGEAQQRAIIEPCRPPTRK